MLGSLEAHRSNFAGDEGYWFGIKGDHVLFDVGYKWKLGGQFVEQPWEIEHAYPLEVQGVPAMKFPMEIRSLKDPVANRLKDTMALGMVIAGMFVVKAVPRPSMLTSNADYLTYPTIEMKWHMDPDRTNKCQIP